MGIAFDARWPEYKSGFLVLQMACYSIILVIFGLQTESKLTIAFLVMAAVQMVAFNYLDDQINLFYGIIGRDQVIVQHGMLLVASLLIMIISFSFYERVDRKAEAQINLLLDQTRSQYIELESQNAEIVAQRE